MNRNRNTIKKFTKCSEGDRAISTVSCCESRLVGRKLHNSPQTSSHLRSPNGDHHCMFVCSFLRCRFDVFSQRVPESAATIDPHRQVHWNLTGWTVCARKTHISVAYNSPLGYARFEWLQRPPHVISISIVNLNGPHAPIATIWSYCWKPGKMLQGIFRRHHVPFRAVRVSWTTQ